MQKSPLHEEVCVPEETTAGLWGPLPDSHVVLFLDFDGVCHRCKNETFERMPLGKRKLTAVCSHQTRIGNLDAHLI